MKMASPMANEDSDYHKIKELASKIEYQMTRISTGSGKILNLQIHQKQHEDNMKEVKIFQERFNECKKLQNTEEKLASLKNLLNDINHSVEKPKASARLIGPPSSEIEKSGAGKQNDDREGFKNWKDTNNKPHGFGEVKKAGVRKQSDDREGFKNVKLVFKKSSNKQEISGVVKSGSGKQIDDREGFKNGKDANENLIGSASEVKKSGVESDDREGFNNVKLMFKKSSNRSGLDANETSIDTGGLNARLRRSKSLMLDFVKNAKKAKYKNWPKSVTKQPNIYGGLPKPFYFGGPSKPIDFGGQEQEHYEFFSSFKDSEEEGVVALSSDDGCILTFDAKNNQPFGFRTLIEFKHSMSRIIGSFRGVIVLLDSENLILLNPRTVERDYSIKLTFTVDYQKMAFGLLDHDGLPKVVVLTGQHSFHYCFVSGWSQEPTIMTEFVPYFLGSLTTRRAVVYENKMFWLSTFGVIGYDVHRKMFDNLSFPNSIVEWAYNSELQNEVFLCKGQQGLVLNCSSLNKRFLLRGGEWIEVEDQLAATHVRINDMKLHIHRKEGPVEEISLPEPCYEAICYNQTENPVSLLTRG